MSVLDGENWDEALHALSAVSDRPFTCRSCMPARFSWRGIAEGPIWEDEFVPNDFPQISCISCSALANMRFRESLDVFLWKM